MKLTVLIASHNPRPAVLARAIAALRAQTLPTSEWELLLIDNCSLPPLARELVAWHPHGRVVVEKTLGLTPARCTGAAAASGDLLVWSDDDNILAPDYLERALTAFDADPALGAAGGRSIPAYECAPPDWYQPDLAPVGCRDLGEARIDARWEPAGAHSYPSAAPIGAGLVIRRSAMLAWVEAVDHDPRRKQLGRTGAQLTSGEDNDIALTVLGAGWKVAYLPGLQLVHLIPPGRLTVEYQTRLARATYRDFVKVLDLHGIRPWRPINAWSVPLRSARAWFKRRAWRGPAARIRWCGDCGQFEGRARL